ncbi:UNVERIFIED_CONTAM: hypothetical protein Sangu_1719100 [Sesamum angustifolium]|uniref:Uncharacterized protein n=1 Tax=Sesamum angustifolium TaxID=2727405 RepID=A0AAW2MNM6_9LAMI
MAGLRQFVGISSAITTSMKGMLCRSSSGAPLIWFERLEGLSEGIQSGQAIVGGPPETAWGEPPVFCLLEA